MELLGRDASLQRWVEEVVKVSNTLSGAGDEDAPTPEALEDDKSLTFRGDALELLTQFICTQSEWDPKTGLQEFRIKPLSQDYGVDATGVNAIGVRTVVQCKFKSNPTAVVTYQDLAKTFTQGVIDGDIDPGEHGNLWVVCTCGMSTKRKSRGLSKQAEDMLEDHLHVLNREDLSSLVDGNESFWEQFQSSL